MKKSKIQKSRHQRDPSSFIDEKDKVLEKGPEFPKYSDWAGKMARENPGRTSEAMG